MKIEFHGDSTQLGNEVWSGVPYPARYPPHVAVAQMVRFYHGDGHQIVCLAKSGSTAIDALTQPTFYPAGNFAAHVAQSDANVIVANWCINDSFVVGNTAAAHAARYTQMKNLCEAAGKAFVAETPNPIADGARNGMLASFSAAVKAIPGISVIDVHNSVSQWYPLWANHLSDGVHPNSIMYRFIGDLLYSGLKSRF